MLFALPNVRNTQPGNPPYGCTSDVVGFFWNILLVAVSGVSLLAVFVYQNFYHFDDDVPAKVDLDLKEKGDVIVVSDDSLKSRTGSFNLTTKSGLQ